MSGRRPDDRAHPRGLRRVVFVIAAMTAVAACGDDGRDMALPTSPTTGAPTTTDLPELSVVVIDETVAPETTTTDAELGQPTSTLSDQARREQPQLCEPFVSVMALEDSRALLAIQDDASKDAAEQKRQRDLDALRDAMLSSTVSLPAEASFAVQTLRLFPMNDGVLDDETYVRALRTTRASLSAVCEVG